MTFEELKERASRIQPRDVVEEDLLHFVNIAISWVERIRRAAAARRELHILESVRRDKQKIEAADLARRLLPTACWMLHGLDIDPSPDGGEPQAESGRKFEYPPPGPLIEQLESTEAGCRCLLDKWAEYSRVIREERRLAGRGCLHIFRLIGKAAARTRSRIRKLLSFSWRQTRSIAATTTPSWNSRRRSGLRVPKTS